MERARDTILVLDIGFMLFYICSCYVHLKGSTLDWALVIHRNRIALIPIIEALFAMLGLATRLEPGVYRRVLRLLKPAESAVRRLIVIVARGVVVKPVAVQPKPSGPITERGKKFGLSFPLFDTRKSFPELRTKRVKRVVPRFYLSGYDPRVAALWPTPRQPAPPPAPVSDGLVDAARITRRLQALKSALEDLPRQAKRLARWRLKRVNISHLKMRYPMRPGRPPGYRKKKTHEVDDILSECHYFAWEALKPDTS
jgi:hypothetical protein